MIEETNANPNDTTGAEEVETSEETTTTDDSKVEKSNEIDALKKAEDKIIDLKKKLKEAKKPSKVEEKSETEKQPDEEFGLLEKTYLRTADIVDEDEVELVKKLMEETGKGVEVIDTKYFKSELEELRTTKTTEKATSEVRGGRGNTKATDSPEHWIAKGVPPTAEQVPDKKTRVKIARAMMANASTGGKKFYND